MSKATAPTMPIEKQIKFRHAYSPQHKVPFIQTKPSLTKQSFRDECDINVIMGRYLRTGVLDFVSKHQPQYMDTTGMDFQRAMLVVAESQTMFNDLPSNIRTQFENNPAKFLDFCHDPKNLPEMAKMGLLRPDAAERLLTPQPAPANAPAAPTAAPATPQAAPGS